MRCLLLLTALAVAPLAVSSASAQPVEAVTVDLSIDLGPATARASGFLHGMTAQTPAQDLVAPLRPRLFRDWADDENGAFAIYDRVKALGARSQIVSPMADAL